MDEDAARDGILEAAGMARRAGLADIADRIEHLYKSHDGDEKGPTSPDAAESLVSFLVRHRYNIPMPYEITADGKLIHCKWKMSENEDIMVQFRQSGDVGFAYIGLGKIDGYTPVYWKGYMTPDKMLEEIALRPAHMRRVWDASAAKAGTRPHPPTGADGRPRQKGPGGDWRNISRIVRNMPD